MQPINFRRRPLFQLLVLVIVLAPILSPQGDISAARVTIPGLFNTGVNDDGQKLKDGDREEHYVFTGGVDGAFIISDGSRPSAWVSSLGQSSWIGPQNGAIDVPAGNYLYTLTFDLGGLDPLTAVISGRWASDNASAIFLNGESTGFEINEFGFMTRTPFTIESGFVNGINALGFYVNNLYSPDRSPSGLLVLDLTGTASEVPIPGAFWLLGSALIALTGIRRRRRG